MLSIPESNAPLVSNSKADSGCIPCEFAYLGSVATLFPRSSAALGMSPPDIPYVSHFVISTYRFIHFLCCFQKIVLIHRS